VSVSVTRILSPDEWKKRQINNLKAVGEANYRVGISHPRKDPIEAGIKAEEKWANAIIDAMPDATDRDREERMLANLRGLKALKGKA